MRNKALLITLAGAVAILVGYGVYAMFLDGRASGPDFIAATTNKGVGVNDVVSLEVLSPPVGHTPFSRHEMDSLQRKSAVTAKRDLADLFAILSRGAKGQVNQSHPVTIYDVYWQVNLRSGDFYFLYVSILRDAARTVCYVNANRRNATNPNGCTLYCFEDFDSLLHLTGESCASKTKPISSP